MSENPTRRRKANHVRIAVNPGSKVESSDTLFGQVHLIHDPLPDLDLDDVDLSTSFVGRQVSMPLIISCMTGGFEGALEINRELALAAQSERIPIGLGSVRAGLEDQGLRPTFSIVRETATSVPVISNIGAQQLLDGGLDTARKAVGMVRGDALAIHFNKLQEAVMPEGETKMHGVKSVVRQVVKALGVPCIAKETGAGISVEAAKSLKGMGFKIVDVAGAGGTSFASVEAKRALEFGDDEGGSVGQLFSDWGIPTAASVMEVASVRGLKVIASGGVRSGLDAAKAIALGADYVAVAKPILVAVVRGGSAAARRWVRRFAKEMRVAMFLAGADDLNALRSTPLVVTGDLRGWAESRGLDLKRYSRR